MSNKKKKYLMPLTGLFIGFINGFFGGGGGMLLVPTLKFIGKEEQKIAQATAIAIILPLSLISAIIYTFNGVSDVNVGLSAGSGVIIGGIAGALLLNKLSNKFLSILFYFLMIAAGVRMVIL